MAAGASFKFLRIFASYCTDSENWASYLDDCFFYELFFGIQWLSLEIPCWHFQSIASWLHIFSFPRTECIYWFRVERSCLAVCTWNCVQRYKEKTNKHAKQNANWSTRKKLNRVVINIAEKDIILQVKTPCLFLSNGNYFKTRDSQSHVTGWDELQINWVSLLTQLSETN